MEDLNDKIARVLADPDSMAKIQSMMAALGKTEEAKNDNTSSVTASNLPPSPQGEGQAMPSSGGGLPDLSVLTKLMPLMGAFDREDDDTRLLQALRPYLHGERAGRLDETMRLLKLTRLLPLLQEQGILGGKEHG